MPRYRATKHCQDCPFYRRIGSVRRRHVCRAWRGVPTVPMSYDQARTSPRWCPLGHVIVGVPYPIFRAGSADPVAADPTEWRDVLAALKRHGA